MKELPVIPFITVCHVTEKQEREIMAEKSHRLLQSTDTEDPFYTCLKKKPTVLQKSFVIHFVGILDQSIFSFKFLLPFCAMTKDDLQEITWGVCPQSCFFLAEKHWQDAMIGCLKRTTDSDDTRTFLKS